MRNTKPNFRAIREFCGLTQQEVADIMDVRLVTVKKWERIGDNNPPDAVFDELCDLYEELIQTAASIYLNLAETMKEEGQTSVVLSYYRTQDQLEEARWIAGVTDETDPVGFVNAKTRIVGLLLETNGFDVEYAYPSKDITFS